MNRRYNQITKTLTYKERSLFQKLQPWKSFDKSEFIEIPKDSPEYATATHEIVLIHGKNPYIINWEDTYAKSVESWYGIS